MEKKKKKGSRYFLGESSESQVTPSEEPVTFDLSQLDTRDIHKKGKEVQKSIKKDEKRAQRKEKKSKGKKGKSKDPFPGDAPVSKSKMKKYKRGEEVVSSGIKTKFHKNQFEQKEKKVELVVKQAARTERLLDEEAGFLEADDGEHTMDVTQHEIADAVDISSAQKFFDLNLEQFGPYRMNYIRNGRQLLIGGRKGHIAAMDWQTKKLLCEINVMETVQDVKWLHIETMFAIAQKQWTYIYDNQGIELHCLKALDQVLRLEFLPYHFLLVSSNAKGYLSYLDVSVGKKVAGFPTGLGRLDVMCQNPKNAIIHMGHTGGTVTLWSPNIKEPLAKMLCHGGGTRSIAIDHTGNYMATSGLDRRLKLWDLRTYKVVSTYRQSAGASHMAFSQRGLLAAGVGNIVEVYKDPRKETISSPYITHRLRSPAQNLQFCPYEDVMGVGHGEGFTSLLIPGAGEPNFDALESNPYQTKKQRQQSEVKMLLEKVQPDMIHLDTSMLGKVDTKTLQEKMEEKKKIMFLKPENIDFEPKYKKKGKSKTGRVEKRKKGVKFQHKQEQIKDYVRNKQKTERTQMGKSPKGQQKSEKSYNVFDRFMKDS